MRVLPKVELIKHTQNPEEVVATAAKLCYASCDVDALVEKVSAADQAKFIERLMAMNHLSPIEHASFTFSIEGVSRALLAQITRHRIASFSVRSQRYVSQEKGFDYIIPPAIEKLGEDAVLEFENQMKTISTWYKDWQEKLGGSKESSNEDARFVLPNATETKMIVTMNARELLHFFELRCCERAQWEIREVAWRMLEKVSAVAPNLFKNAGAPCIKGKCPEGAKSCGKQAMVKLRKEEFSNKN